MTLFLFLSIVILTLIQFYIIYKNFSKKFIELHVLVDNDGRICYSGEYKDLIDKKTPELKLIRLEGVIK